MIRIAIRVACAALMAFASAPTASAATLTWSATGTSSAIGGTGAWDTTNARWTADGSTWSAWSNSANDVAWFGGTAGTVTQNTGITANGLTFATTGYTVTGNTITLGGSDTLTVDVADAGHSATVSSVFQGVAGSKFTKSGAGTLQLSGGNNRISTGFTGVWTVTGTLGAATGSINTVYGSGITLDNGSLSSLGTGDSGIGSFWFSAGKTITATGTNNSVSGVNVVAIASGQTLTFAAPTTSDAVTVSGNILNSGNVAKTGAGTVTLSANNTYSGNTTVSGGVLTLANNAALPNTTAISVASGATLNLNGNNNNQIQSGFTRDSANAASLAISGTMNVGPAIHTMYAWTISTTNGTINFTNSGGYLWMPTRTITFNGGSNAVTGNSSNGLRLEIASGTLTLSTPLSTDAVTINAPLTAASGGNFAKIGSGLVSLQGANNRIGSGFSGVWTVTGTLGVADTTAHTVYGSGITLNNGSLSSLGAGNTSNGSFYFFASKTITASGTANFITGSNVVLVNAGQTLTFSTPTTSDAVTVSGNMLGANVAKTGSGLLVFSGANTYSGSTTISSGTLQVGAGGTTGSLGSGAVTNNATLRFARSDSITVANAITGSGAVIMGGSGQLLFNAVKEYTGGTVVNSGTLRLDGAGGQTGVIRGSLTINQGATVQSDGAGTSQWALGFGGATSGVAVSDIVIVGGTLTFGTAFNSNSGISAATVTMTGGSIGGQPWDWFYGSPNSNFNPTLATQAAATTATVDGLRLRLTGAGSLTFDVAAGSVTGGDTPGVDLLVGVIADRIEPGAAVIKTGPGVMRFSGSNSYIGPTTISGGTLALSAAGDIASSSGVSLTASGAGFSIAAASGNRTIAGLTGVAGSAVALGANTLTVNTTTSGTFAGGISGSGGFTKAGAGKLSLTSVQPLTGPLTVSAGELDVSAGAGSLGSASSIVVAGGATLSAASGLTLSDGQTLGGNGTVTGDVVYEAGSTLSPGASPGTLTVNGLQTWEGGANYNWQIYRTGSGAGVGWDLVTGTGSLDLTATSGNPYNINIWSLSSIGPDVNGDVSDFDPNASYSFRIAEFDGGITGFDPLKFVINTGPLNGTGGFSNDFDGVFSVRQGINGGGENLNQVYIVYAAAVPEPGTLALAGIGLAVAAVAVRRRARRS